MITGFWGALLMVVCAGAALVSVFHGAFVLLRSLLSAQRQDASFYLWYLIRPFVFLGVALFLFYLRGHLALSSQESIAGPGHINSSKPPSALTAHLPASPIDSPTPATSVQSSKTKPNNTSIASNPRSRQVVLLLDKSESMRKDGRFERAKLLVQELVDSLSGEDAVGLIVFDSLPFKVVSLQPADSARPLITERLNLIVAADRTDLEKSLGSAVGEFQHTTAEDRRVVVISDYKKEFDSVDLAAICSQFAEAKIDLRFVRLAEQDFLFICEESLIPLVQGVEQILRPK